MKHPIRYKIQYNTHLLGIANTILTVHCFARGMFNAEMQAFKTCNRMGYDVLSIRRVA